jgi:dolichol kinase
MNFSEELKKELKRKLGRFIIGTIAIPSIIYIKTFYNHATLINAGFIILLLIVFFDYLRVDKYFSVPFFHNSFVLRSSEKYGVHNITFACLGYLLAVSFFDFNIALAAIAVSIYADGLAAIIGMGIGRTKIYHGKSLEGSMTMALISLVVGILFIKNIWLILTLATIATLLELFVKNYPDDLIIPLYAGFGTQLAAVILGLRPLAQGFSLGLLIWVIMAMALALFFLGTIIYKKLRR